MTTKREAKRQALRTRLIEAAGKRIAEGGLANFRARDVAADVGCALGGIYTVFEDLDDLILHVNASTLDRMRQELTEAAKNCGPGEALRTLARGYARFARENGNVWDALFDHRMGGGRPVPDWLLAEHSVLLRYIMAPLAALQPGLSEEELRTRARTYYGAVHGIVTFSLQQRFLGLPEDRLTPELDIFVGHIVDGMLGRGTAE